MKTEDGRTDIVLPVPGEVWGMNPANGKLRWFAETDITGNVSPSPVIGGGTVYVFGGYPRTALGTGLRAPARRPRSPSVRAAPLPR